MPGALPSSRIGASPYTPILPPTAPSHMTASLQRRWRPPLRCVVVIEAPAALLPQRLLEPRAELGRHRPALCSLTSSPIHAERAAEEAELVAIAAAPDAEHPVDTHLHPRPPWQGAVLRHGKQARHLVTRECQAGYKRRERVANAALFWIHRKEKMTDLDAPVISLGRAGGGFLTPSGEFVSGKTGSGRIP